MRIKEVTERARLGFLDPIISKQDQKKKEYFSPNTSSDDVLSTAEQKV